VTSLLHDTSLWVSLVGGLLTGFLTGYYFQWRQVRASAAANARLRDELSALRAAVFSRVGGDSRDACAGETLTADFRAALMVRAISIQDASGRVDRHELRAFFLQQGSDVHDVDANIELLCASGALRREGQWLIIV
jgi:hypothetical protein